MSIVKEGRVKEFIALLGRGDSSHGIGILEKHLARAQDRSLDLSADVPVPTGEFKQREAEKAVDPRSSLDDPGIESLFSSIHTFPTADFSDETNWSDDRENQEPRWKSFYIRKPSKGRKYREIHLSWSGVRGCIPIVQALAAEVSGVQVILGWFDFNGQWGWKATPIYLAETGDPPSVLEREIVATIESFGTAVNSPADPPTGYDRAFPLWSVILFEDADFDGVPF